MVSQSCQQHIPAGAGVVVVVHSSSQRATHAAKTAGLVGHSLMHADSDPPGQPLGAGGVGAGAGAAVVVAVVLAGQSCLHTETHISYASPVTTEHAATQALIDPPGQPPEGDGDGGGGVGVGVGGGVGVGDGAGGNGSPLAQAWHAEIYASPRSFKEPSSSSSRKL